MINPPQNSIGHAGIKGMHWGIRKAEDVGGGSPRAAAAVAKATAPGNRISYRQQIQGHALLAGGRAAAQAGLRKYGHLAVPALKGLGKVGFKGSAAAAKFAFRAGKGSGMALKILKVVGKGGFKVGKGYLKTAIAIGRMGRG